MLDLGGKIIIKGKKSYWWEEKGPFVLSNEIGRSLASYEWSNLSRFCRALIGHMCCNNVITCDFRIDGSTVNLSIIFVMNNYVKYFIFVNCM